MLHVSCFMLQILLVRWKVSFTTSQMESTLWPLCLTSVACFVFQVPELSRCQEKKSEPGRFEPTAPLLLAGTLTPILARLLLEIEEI